MHACVKFDSVFRGGSSALDLPDDAREQNPQGHPNKQDPRVWGACVNYVKKYGDFLEGPEQVPKKSTQEAVQSFQFQEDWMQHCIEQRISYQYAIWFWNQYHSDVFSLTEPGDCKTMCQSLRDFQFDTDLHKTIVIKGPSGCGKTNWAKSQCPLPCLFVTHVDTLKKFRPGYHRSIIFDDVEFNHFPRTSQIHLVDFENARSIHCRNTCADIPAGVYKIFTCNDLPIQVDDPAIRRRVKVFNVLV